LPIVSPPAPDHGRRRALLGDALIAITAGLALGLAFPRFDWDALAWVALAPLFVTAVTRSPRAAFGWGWLTGLVFFAVLLRWLNFTFSVYSTIPWPLTLGPTLALAGYCGLYFGLVAAAMAWVSARRSAAWALAAAPFFWVAAEWVRGHLMEGFPWGSLGYSQYLRLTVIQVAELGGIHAVSFVVALANSAVAALVVLPWRRAAVALIIAAAVVGGSLAFGAARLAEPSRAGEVRIAVMQPSIEQPLKWDDKHIATTLAIYMALTRRAANEHPDLLVWPETASPTILTRDEGLLKTLTYVADSQRMPLLVGSVDGDDTRGYRNTAFLVTEKGIVGRYDKIHLVPFGEYVPLSRVIGFVKGWAEFISELEPGSAPVVFPGPPAPFGTVICYEGIFPDLYRKFVKGGARLMINMTNDAWFGRTSGPAQHLAMYPLRAVEHRTAVVRAANTGISAFIAPSGRIVRWMRLFERGTMIESLPLRSGQTLYTRVGDWVAWLSFAVVGVTLGAAALARRRNA
jgi:apolipoprotein N-acyltransferase